MSGLVASHVPARGYTSIGDAVSLDPSAGACLAMPAPRLFVGGHAATVQGEPATVDGDRCFTAVHPPKASMAPNGAVLLDSGAFSDAPAQRLSFAGAAARQAAWEVQAGALWGRPGWHADVWVSYDLLIDETWLNGHKTKRRWTVTDAAPAIDVTVQAAQYLASQRAALAPRVLCLSCQGVTPAQYESCVRRVLAAATPADWIGFGGWCILGRFTTWLPAFYETISRCLPLVAAAGVRHVHLFGVLLLEAVGALCWLADQYGITISSDSSAPLLACTRSDPKKAGVRAPYWRDNIAVWHQMFAGLRQTPYYQMPKWQQGWAI